MFSIFSWAVQMLNNIHRNIKWKLMMNKENCQQLTAGKVETGAAIEWGRGNRWEECGNILVKKPQHQLTKGHRRSEKQSKVRWVLCSAGRDTVIFHRGKSTAEKSEAEQFLKKPRSRRSPWLWGEESALGSEKITEKDENIVRVERRSQGMYWGQKWKLSWNWKGYMVEVDRNNF